MAKIYGSLLELVGKTPLVQLKRIGEGLHAVVLGKMEMSNPGGSVKDRIGLSMVETAEREGKLRKGMTIVEPTSGNTGIALAWVAAIKGYRLILTMPDTMSVERRNLLKALGAEVVLTEGAKGMKGSIARAEEIVRETGNAFLPHQFRNPANPEIHRKTTAEEIWKDTNGKVDVFVAGIGTGGTITGVGEVLKAKRGDIRVVAVEPEGSPVLSGGEPGKHKIQGIGAGFVPEVLNTAIYDEVIRVKDQDAFETSRKLARQEGILCGISAGANVWAALEVAKRPESEGRTIVTVLCDTGERYLSTALYS